MAEYRKHLDGPGPTRPALSYTTVPLKLYTATVYYKNNFSMTNILLLTYVVAILVTAKHSMVANMYGNVQYSFF